jgi:hypothetical protein
MLFATHTRNEPFVWEIEDIMDILSVNKEEVFNMMEYSQK